MRPISTLLLCGCTTKDCIPPHSTFTEFHVLWWGGWSEHPAAEGSSSAWTKATVRLQAEIKNFKPRRVPSWNNRLEFQERPKDGWYLSHRRRCHPAVIRWMMMMHRTNLNISSTQCEKTNPDCHQNCLRFDEVVTTWCVAFYRHVICWPSCFTGNVNSIVFVACLIADSESTALIHIKRLSRYILSFLPQGLSLNPLKHISCGFMGVVFFIVKQLQLLMRLSVMWPDHMHRYPE